MTCTLTSSPGPCCFPIWRVENEKTLGTMLICALPPHCHRVVSHILKAHTWVLLLRNRNVVRVYIIMGILLTVINGSKTARKLPLYFLPCLSVMQQRFSLVSLRYLYLPAFSGHRPAQRQCPRTGLRSHARCHPYPIPQPVKVGHTTGVYVPYSFRTVVWVLLRPTRTDQWKCCETGPTVFRPYSRRLGRGRKTVGPVVIFAKSAYFEGKKWAPMDSSDEITSP